LTTVYRLGVACSTFAAVVFDVLVVPEAAAVGSRGRTVTSTRLPTWFASVSRLIPCSLTLETGSKSYE
jgi:hypothetical protein